MKVTDNCIAIIKHYEGFQPKPYLCPANIATIGYGTTVYDNGKKVRLNDHEITEAEATEQLLFEVNKKVASVAALLKVDVTQSMFDALVSFAYNLGTGALAGSTLLKLINDGITTNSNNWKRIITAEFNKWVKATVGGKKVALSGLVARRGTEALLFTNDLLKFFN